MKNDKRILNDDIKAFKVKLISEVWEVLWEMTLQEAKNIALEKELDLMQVWEKDWAVIVKMLDYWKFLYKQKKQEQKNKQKQRSSDIKTIKITFKIWDHDLEVKKNQAKKFASNWHPLKVILTLRWRENHYEDIAKNKIEKFVSSLEDFYKIDKWLVRNWNNFIITLLPK